VPPAGRGPRGPARLGSAGEGGVMSVAHSTALEAARASIDAVREAHVAALNTGDVAGFLNLFTPDGVQMPPNAPENVGRESIGAWLQAFAAPFRRFEFSLSVAELQVAGPWAFERGSYRIILHPTTGGDPLHDEGKYITIYE